MLQLTINEKGGPSRTESFDKEEITIGRVHGNDIILPKGNISKRHSRIAIKDGKFVVFDLKSTNGTYVNGKKIAGPQVIKATDKVYIGDFTLQIDFGENGSAEGGLGGRAGDEVDLFGGNAPPFEPEPGPASPGLLEDNFENEFGSSSADAKARLPRASKKGLASLTGAELQGGPPPAASTVQASNPDGVQPAPKLKMPSMSLAKPGGVSSNEPRSAAPVAEPPGESWAVVSGNQGQPSANSVSKAASSVMPMVVHAMSNGGVEAEPLALDELLIQLQRIVAGSLKLQEQPISILADLKTRVKETTEQVLDQIAAALPPGYTSDKIIETVVSRLVGVEPLVEFLIDDAVFEVVVTADRRILVDREGRLEDSGRSMGSDSEVVGAIHSLALMGGVEPGELGAAVDTRLRSGDRLMASLPPHAFRGPTLAVRKTTRDFFTLEKLREYDTINGILVPLLEEAVRLRQNILLSTGPGVSPTATLNALLSQMPADERIITAEAGVEFHLRGHVHAVAFDLRNSVDVSEVLHHAMVSQTERVIVAELRDCDAVPVLEAFRSHLEGGAMSIAAPSPELAIERLTEWVCQKREGTDAEQAKRIVEQAIGLVLQERRLSDGSRRITQASELVVNEGKVELQPLCSFKPTGLDENNMVIGTFVSSGRAPSFLRALVDQGEIEMDLSVFKAKP